jgi:hypothetical protein
MSRPSTPQCGSAIARKTCRQPWPEGDLADRERRRQGDHDMLRCDRSMRGAPMWTSPSSLRYTALTGSARRNFAAEIAVATTATE